MLRRIIIFAGRVSAVVVLFSNDRLSSDDKIRSAGDCQNALKTV